MSRRTARAAERAASTTAGLSLSQSNAAPHAEHNGGGVVAPHRRGAGSARRSALFATCAPPWDRHGERAAENAGALRGVPSTSASSPAKQTDQEDRHRPASGLRPSRRAASTWRVAASDVEAAACFAEPGDHVAPPSRSMMLECDRRQRGQRCRPRIAAGRPIPVHRCAHVRRGRAPDGGVREVEGEAAARRRSRPGNAIDRRRGTRRRRSVAAPGASRSVVGPSARPWCHEGQQAPRRTQCCTPVQIRCARARRIQAAGTR